MAYQDRFYAEVRGIRLHFLQYGMTGPQVLLLPGITSPAITWGFVAERIAAHARVTVLDNRGRGLSDQRGGLGHSTADYATDAAGIIEALGMGPAVVLGHSMGARIAARLCATHGPLVSRCILADPPVSGPGRRAYPSGLQKYLDHIDMASRGEDIPAGPNFSAAQLRLRTEWLPTCSKEAVALSHKAFHEDDMFADLVKIGCATLLVQAGTGDVIRDSDAEEILGCLKSGSKIKVEGAGHMIPFDDLEAFIGAVVPFILQA
jgi:N-formylmaleamate deformylase